MKPYINNVDDIMAFLDDQVESIAWDNFYELRERPAPFIVQNELPDENLVEFIAKGRPIESAIVLGCGEGRNAIYMAGHGLSVTAYDLSGVAIKNAKDIAKRKGFSVDFHNADVFITEINGKYDFAYDSGMFHHLAPHRRIAYIELLKQVLKPCGYFGLTCFARGAHEVDDWEFYKTGAPGGVVFTKERLVEMFSPYFKVVEIREYKDGIENTIQGLGSFMWVCLFQNADI